MVVCRTGLSQCRMSAPRLCLGRVLSLACGERGREGLFFFLVAIFARKRWPRLVSASRGWMPCRVLSGLLPPLRAVVRWLGLLNEGL